MMALTNRDNLHLFPKVTINLHSYLPDNVQVPSVPEGISILTITNCVVKKNSSEYHLSKEKIEVDLIDGENRSLKQVYYLNTGMVNFAKFVDSVTGEVPIEEFDPSTLVGVKIKASIFHNYLSSGKGYANIATCELYSLNNELKD